MKKETKYQIKKWRLLNCVCFENIPQFSIQLYYIWNTNNISDSFIVVTAMIFSGSAIIISLLTTCLDSNRQAINKHNLTMKEYEFREKRRYKMELICDEFKSYHKFTKSILNEIICNLLRIDLFSCEVYYVYNMRNGIVCYIELTNVIEKNQSEIFVNMVSIGDNNGINGKGSALNIAMKEDICTRFNFDKSGVDLMEILVSIDEKGLEYDKNLKIVSFDSNNETTLPFTDDTTKGASASPNVQPQAQAPAPMAFGQFEAQNKNENDNMQAQIQLQAQIQAQAEIEAQIAQQEEQAHVNVVANNDENINSGGEDSVSLHSQASQVGMEGQ